MTLMTSEINETQPNKKGRYTLLAIVFVSVLPLAAAYFVFFTGIGVPDTTVNAGTLIAKPVSVEPLVTETFWQEMQKDKKWRLLLPIPASCLEECQEHFYVTRQVHVRLGEKGLRVERFAVNHSGDSGTTYLQSITESHPQLKSVNVSPSDWRRWVNQIPLLENYSDSHFYLLVDQEGYAMMVYSGQHGNELLKDIKRALKYSLDYQ